jgi:ribose-phosphate pyrophosphokinase
MQQFSMSHDPKSWVELINGELAYDQYPDGSFAFRIENLTLAQDYQIVNLKSTLPQSIMAAGQVIDALHSMGLMRTILSIQTLPDQRGDKHTKPRDCVPLRVTVAMIAALEPSRVVLHDVHSPEAFEQFAHNGYELDDNLMHIDSLECFKLCTERPSVNSNSYVVAVDKGALERATKFAKEYDCKLVVMEKTRDVDGKITGHEISSIEGDTIPAGSHVWVVDDLCDGGATFNSVSNAIASRNFGIGMYHLYVTHGLFSKGRSELLAHYDSVSALFSYDGWRNE